MLIFDDVYAWEGWGGALQLQAGRCRLRIFDLRKGPSKKVVLFKPVIALVSELPSEAGKKKNFLSLRSCIGHIATRVSEEFSLDPQRTMWVEYYPARHYGPNNEKCIPERFDRVRFRWRDGKALQPAWEPLEGPLRDMLRQLQTTGRLSNKPNNPITQ